MKKDKAEILLEEEEEVGGFPNMDKYLEGRERRGWVTRAKSRNRRGGN